MKSYILICFVLIVLMLLTGCGNKPQAVAGKFLSAIEGRDYGTASKFVTKSSQVYLQYLQQSYDKMAQEDKEELAQKTFKVQDGFVDNETATINYQEKVNGSDAPESKELKMENENGEWKVKLERNSTF